MLEETIRPNERINTLVRYFNMIESEEKWFLSFM